MLELVPLAYGADSLGLVPVINLIALSIRAIGVVIFGVAATVLGIRILGANNFEHLYIGLIGLGVGGGLILAAPTIAQAALGGAAGATLDLVTPALNELIGDWVSVALYWGSLVSFSESVRRGARG